jgi:hypothetical protein
LRPQFPSYDKGFASKGNTGASFKAACSSASRPAREGI